MRQMPNVLAGGFLLIAACTVEAVVLRMTNASGGGSITLFPGISDDLQIRIDTNAIDTLPVSLSSHF